MKPGLERRGRLGPQSPKGGDIGSQLFQPLGELGEIFPLQLDQCVVEWVAHMVRSRS
jgi:hypothetical protein